MCLTPDAELSNVIPLRRKSDVTPMVMTNTHRPVVVDTCAQFYAEEDAENAKAARECGYSLAWWVAVVALSVSALLTIVFADPVALSTTTTQGR